MPSPLATALAEFNRIYGVFTSPEPTVDIPDDIRTLRVRLVSEEHRELIEAIDERDLAHIAKEAADLAYVLRGTTDAYGFDLDTARGTIGSATAWIAAGPTIEVPADALDLNLARLDDTFDRLIGAMTSWHPRLPRISEAAADLYFALRLLALGYGIDLDAAITEVHASNMTKLAADGTVLRDAGGKVIKGPNYREADMATILGLPLA